MKTLLSAKRQISIPKALCEELEMAPGSHVEWEIRDGLLIGTPLPKDAWKNLPKMFTREEAKRGWNAFLEMRREERARE
ncbi:MAG TPA: AbrB/MazE/SpoVT family DNA-binding domain-containing protein [Verrucomicrobiales bacterium]|jgi:antitoxin component of MazEF toxin-antitoxin module|nr:AbrB/MazE/SpoVT family DNA-binding domain-containing protein [Verrucomicrobiales bacterium]HIL24198.1 AbrB/MazE/SpoVT family DNA-binding domain-containing protein [Verrucomicrobiota bacterium]